MSDSEDEDDSLSLCDAGSDLLEPQACALRATTLTDNTDALDPALASLLSHDPTGRTLGDYGLPERTG